MIKINPLFEVHIHGTIPEASYRAAEEKAYLEAYQKGDETAKDILIERNLRLVAHVVKKYQGIHEDLDDLLSLSEPSG